MHHEIPEVKLNYTFTDKKSLLQALDSADFDEYRRRGDIEYKGETDTFMYGLFKQYGICDNIEDLDEAFDIFKKLNTDSDAINQLGLLYWHYKKDAVRSFVMWYRSYRMGNLRAALNIAYYSQKCETPTMHATTLNELYKYITASYSQDDINIKYAVATYHRNNNNDIETSKRLLRYCAKQGHVSAIVDLADIYDNDCDFETALNLLNKAKSTGYSYVVKNIIRLEGFIADL
jgi:hypothetical protein